MRRYKRAEGPPTILKRALSSPPESSLSIRSLVELSAASWVIGQPFLCRMTLLAAGPPCQSLSRSLARCRQIAEPARQVLDDMVDIGGLGAVDTPVVTGFDQDR